jgi:hypothetical protein
MLTETHALVHEASAETLTDERRHAQAEPPQLAASPTSTTRTPQLNVPESGREGQKLLLVAEDTGEAVGTLRIDLAA